jgi:hypothetical protein
MRAGRNNLISWAMAGLTLLFTAGAHAVNEQEDVDLQKMHSTKEITLYIYMGQLVNMNEENFFRKSCIYKTADRDKVLALLRIINFSRLEKNESRMARPEWLELDRAVWGSAAYAVKLNYLDNTSAWLTFEPESFGGGMDGYYTYLPGYNRFPIIGPDLLGTSLRMWTQLLGSQPQVAANSTHTVEQCEKVITGSVYMR